MRLVLIALLLWPAMIRAETRAALVLGVERYAALRPLANPVNDARAVEKVLLDLGFEVTLETNRDLRRMRRALEDFAYDYEGADVALIYFAGHGMEVAGQNMLLPTDTPAEDLDALRKGALPLDEVAATLQSVAPVGLLILDACRSDPFDATNGAEARGALSLSKPETTQIQPGLARMGRSDNLLYVFAAAPGQAALDGQGDNSPFTTALTRHLATPGLEIRQVLTLVQQDVYDRTRGKQLPYVESGLPQMVFAGGTTDLPEREALLLSMAGMEPTHRALIERIAAENDMPLAPLFGAFLSADLSGQSLADQSRNLTSAAQAFAKARRDLQQLSSDDPEVSTLRLQAEEHLALGAFQTARASLSDAAEIDRSSRDTLKTNYLTRTLSEAETHYLNAQAAEADLRRDLAIADYEQAIALLEEVHTLSGEVPARLPIATLQLGDALLLAGDLGAARAAFARTRLNAAAFAAQAPDDLPRLRDVMVAHNRLGAAELTAGAPVAAQKEFDAAHKLATQLAAHAPDNDLWQSDLALSHSKLGDVASALGYLALAQAHYRSEQEIAREVARRNPTDVDALRGIVISANKQGDVAMAQGHYPEASDHFARALDLAAQMSAQLPDNTQLLHDHWVGQIKTGDAAQAQSDERAARVAYAKALTLAEDLAARDPANAGWQRVLLSSHNRLGNVAMNLGELATARDAFAKGLALTKALTSLDPGNTEWQRDLWVSHDRLGQVAENAGDMIAAQQAYGLALEVARGLAARDGNVVQWQLDLVVSHYKLSRTGADQIDNLSTALDILRDLQNQNRLPPANESWVGQLSGELAVLRRRISVQE